MLAIVNGHLLTVTQGEIEKGTILIENGKITAVGAHVNIPADAEILDVKGHFVMPGMIDAHTSIGLKEGGWRWEGADHIESTEAVVPQLRAVDGFNPEDVALLDALEAGVTTAHVAPGDVNVLGGVSGAFKLSGYLADEMFIADVGVKAALGEQPKNIFGRKKMPSTRMGTAALLRETLVKAQEYQQKLILGLKDETKKPKRELKLEVMAQVLEHKLPLYVHAHRADDIMTAIRIAKEFDIKIILVHAYEAHKVAKYLVKYQIPVVYGSIWSCRWYVETANFNMATPAILAKQGVKVALTTSHPDKPIYMLPMCAALAVREGMSPNEALKAITINAAEVVGLSERIGSIEVGKDADLVVMSGHPLQLMSKVAQTIIDGKIVYQGE